MALIVLSDRAVRRDRAPAGVVRMSYTAAMPTVNFRTDGPSELALAELTSDGATVSEAIRQALVDAVRLRRREQMRFESREVSADPADLAESQRIRAEMDDLRAW